MSNHFYVKFGKFPGQIARSMRTNVANLKGWTELNPEFEANRRAVHEGGQVWHWDLINNCPRRKDVVVITPAADHVDVGETNVVTLVGVPAEVSLVTLVINGVTEVEITRDRRGVLDTLDLEWDQPTPVTLSLSKKNVTLRAEPRLISFIEPEPPAEIGVA